MSLNRREFVAAAVATASCACLGLPVIAADANSAPSPAPVNAGTLDNYRAQGVVDRFAKSNNILLVRQGDRLYATSAMCTHRNCLLKPIEGDLRCPCHGSRFRLDGTVSRGPAREVLVRYAISSDGQKVIVDPSKKFTQSDWENPLSYIKLT